MHVNNLLFLFFVFSLIDLSFGIGAPSNKPKVSRRKNYFFLPLQTLLSKLGPVSGRSWCLDRSRAISFACFLLSGGTEKCHPILLQARIYPSSRKADISFRVRLSCKVLPHPRACLLFCGGPMYND